MEMYECSVFQLLVPDNNNKLTWWPDYLIIFLKW